ncbi:MAG: rRNA maturation RNase YbeY [Patescibacteria group bacterium]
MIEINNLAGLAVDKKFFTGVAKKVLKGENKEKKNLSVVFVPTGEIRKLNKKYRKKNKATDVLSFGGVSSFKLQVLKDDLGEVIICPAFVKENAKKYKTSIKEELTKVLTHGILHLLEYNHEKTKKEAEIMEKKEEHYLSSVI